MSSDDSKVLHEENLLKLKPFHCSDLFNENIKIARYMGFDKFKDMLDNKSIYFSNIEKFDDNKERTIPVGFFKKHSSSQINSRQKLEKLRDDIYKTYVSCWTKYEGENYSFWRIYTPKHDGVCVICDFKKLYEQFNHDVTIPYQVEYVDYNDTNTRIDLPVLYVQDTDLPANPVLRVKEKYKIYPYRDEREIRFLAFYGKQSSIVPNGCLMKIHDFDWIDEILISPFAKEGTSNQIKNFVSKYGIPQSKIKHSNIDESTKATRNSLTRIESPRRNLEFEQLQIYYQSKGLKLNDKFPETLDLLTPRGEFNYVAYLLADENGTSIKVAKYAGTDKIDLIENEEYGYCSLIKATKSVLNKFEIENKTFAKITSKERIETKLVDRSALREAIINAMVHNDYSSEVPPLFEIFSDKFVITSYGGLIDGLDKEEFFSCCSNVRNRELMRIFKDVGLVEQLGSGMKRILDAYDKSIFEFSRHFMKVTFKFADKVVIHQKSGENTTKVVETSGGKKRSPRYEEQKELVINYLKQNEVAKSEDFIDVLGVKISRVRIILSKMVKDGCIVAEGNTKNRVYKL